MREVRQHFRDGKSVLRRLPARVLFVQPRHQTAQDIRRGIDDGPVPFARLNVAELNDSLPRQLSAQQLSPRQPVGWKYIASLVADLEVHRGVREIPPEFVDRRVARHAGGDCVGIHQPARLVLHRNTFANAAQNRRQLIARAPQILLSSERELVQPGSLQGLGTLPRKREE